MEDQKDKAAAAAEANAAIAGSVPRIDAPHDGHVELLRGIELEGTWHKTAEVRELNGADEEAMSRFDTAKRSMPEFVSLVLSRAVVTIGDINVSKMPMIVDSLIIGDRDLLFLGIIEATYGVNRNFSVTCDNPECRTSNDVTIDLHEDFPGRDVGDMDMTATEHEVKLRDGVVVGLRLPTGDDQVSVTRNQKASMPERNTLMLARCLTSVNGAPMPQSGAKAWAQAISMPDRRTLVEFLANAPGPQAQEVKVPCASCGEEISIPMDWASLLYA